MTFTDHDVWSRLKNTRKPVVLYGMGNGADKILSVFSRCGIECAGVFASDGFARGNLFHGFPVLDYSAICERLNGDFCVVVSFASSREEVIANVLRIAAERELYIPDLPVAGDEIWTAEYASEHADKLSAARALLCDARSREVFDLVCEARTTGRTEPLFASADPEDAVWSEILRPERYASYADLGAYTGDTVRLLASKSEALSRVYAVEPDRRSFAKLQAYLEQSGLDFTAVHAAAWDSDEVLLPFEDGAGRGSVLGKGKAETATAALDSIVGCGRVDYIKYDVEGAEYEALEGSRRTIERCRPDLRVAIYHRPGDIFRLTLFVHRLLPGHKLFLRRARSFPSWDLDLFAVGG